MLYKNKPHIKKVTTATEFHNAKPGTEEWKRYRGNLVIEVKCRVTEQISHVEVVAGDMDRWLGLGQYAQVVFSYLSPSDRELLISGTSDEGWAKLFGDEVSNEDLAKEEEILFKLKNNQV